MPTRRDFIRRSGEAAAVAVLAPQSVATVAQAASKQDARRLLHGGKFTRGVLSGDPTPDGITLLTFVDDVEASGRVRLEVARDRAFRKVVASETIATRSEIDHSVKARIRGLEPGERYYYRFETASERSEAGRFQTAPDPTSNEPLRFGFFSCQEYTFGYFNAHKVLAAQDLDFVVNLGDYIYSDVAFGGPVGVRPVKFDALNAQKLAEYRQRYRVYRQDADLRRMHSRFPMVSLWDDHEVQNDYAGGDPKGGSVTGGDFGPYSQARRAAAYRAFYEQMPTFPVKRGGTRLYHRAAFGHLMDLFVLDERQYRAAQPCDDRKGPACPELGDPRAFLGAPQRTFLKSGLKRSKAAWKVIANEVVMMPLKISDTDYDSFDAWQGYPVERESLLRTVRDVDDVVFITGDYHAFIAGDVRTSDGTTVAAEFVGGSVTSATDPETKALFSTPGYGTYDRPQMPEQAQRVAANPYYEELDFLHHGAVVCEVSRSSFKATFKKLQTIRQRSTALAPGKTYTVRRGHPGL